MPTCSNCSRRNQQCDYLALQQAVQKIPRYGTALLRPRSARSLLTYLNSSNALQSVQTNPSWFSNTESDASELMYHFRSKTCSTLGLVPRSPDLWQTKVPQQAEQSSFLRQSILCISALHVYHLGPPNAEYYYLQACKHQDQASALFRQQVGEVTAENCLEVVAFCIIVAMFNMRVSLQRREAVENLQPFNVFGTLLALRSGWLLIGKTLIPQTPWPILQGYVGAVMQPQQSPLMDQSTKQALYGLELVGKRLPDVGAPNYEGLSLGLTVLRRSFMRFTTRPKGWLPIVIWPSSVPDCYFRELKMEHPVAVILSLLVCGAEQCTGIVVHGWLG
jgi:hypothetical protein